MKRPIKILFWLYIALMLYGLFSCTEDAVEPELDCYQIAKKLEQEQFEAYQNYASTSEIRAIRSKYEELYPECRWD